MTPIAESPVGPQLQASSDLPLSMSLAQLLQREDVWVGYSHQAVACAAVPSGYEALDAQLVNQGWPLGSLIEICHPPLHGDWQLLIPALRQLSGLVVLVNPPVIPFSQALIQAGIDLERLIIVDAGDKPQFIASFIELMRANVGAVLAWQPRASLSYTETRKCLLSASEGSGLAVLFRPMEQQRQSSPASLRLSVRLGAQGMEVNIFKQKGQLQSQQLRPLVLPLPDTWKPAPRTSGEESGQDRRKVSLFPQRGAP